MRALPLAVLMLSAPALAQEAEAPPPSETTAAPEEAPAPQVTAPSVAQPAQAPPGYPHPTPNGYPAGYPYPPYYPPPAQQPVAPAGPVEEPSVPPVCKPVRLGTPKELERIMGELYGEGAREFIVIGNGALCGWR